MIITIDGPAGAGKSTIAKLLAKRLNFFYVDTGAMYRAVTLKAIRNKIPFSDTQSLIRMAEGSKVTFKKGNGDMTRVLLDQEDVTAEIRLPEVTNEVFHIARIPQVRDVMVSWQREYAQSNDIVMEGRDIGTVVFPDAEKKFYLDASAKVRAQRRLLELRQTNVAITLEELIRQIEERDEKDKTRSCGPLKIAKDAVYVDTTELTIEQVVDMLFSEISR